MDLALKKYKNLFNFGIALLFVVLAAAVTLLVPALGDGGMYFLFLAAIIFSTLYGDWRSGVFAVALSFIGNILLLWFHDKSLHTLGEWVVLLAFGLASSFTVYVSRARVESEIARRLAEDRYRMIFENAMTGIYETTLKGKYLAANPKLARIFGFQTADEMINDAPDLNGKFYVEKDRRKEFMRLVAENGGVSGFESEIYRLDGAKIWITENAVAVRDENGVIAGFQGTTIEITDRKRFEEELKQARDDLETKVAERTAELENTNKALMDEITERRKTEISLRQSEEKFRALVEVSSEMIWEVDNKSKYTYVSPNSAEFNGYEPHEILGRTPLDFMPPEEIERFAEIFKQFGEKKEPFYFLETITVNKDGTPGISETSGVPFFDEAGNYHGFRGVGRNVTDRHRAEIALRESEKRYRELVENAHDVIYTEDLQGNYLSVNRRGAELFGYPQDEVKNLKLTDIVAPEYLEAARRMREEKLNGKDLTVYEVEVLTSDGRRVPVEVSSWLMYDENGQPSGIHGIARDITERRRARAEQISSQRRLRDLSAHLLLVREAERKKLARELHDELGQILTALKIGLVRLGEKISGAKKITLALECEEKVRQMLSIIDGAMDTTRQIVAELRPGVLDELGLAAAVEWQTGEFQKHTGIKCRLEIEFSENATCINHKTAVFRIFQECLTNVARHSGAKEVRILLRNEEVRLFLEVEDDGRGITNEETGDPHKFGVLGMRERALLLDGTFDISRVSERGGTRVAVSIPCPLGGVN